MGNDSADNVSLEVRELLDSQRALETVAVDLLTRPLAELDDVLRKAVSSLCSSLQAAGAALYIVRDDDPDAGKMALTPASCAQGERSPVSWCPALSCRDYPSFAASLERREIFAAGAVSDLPTSAVAERAWAEQHGFRPVLAVPLSLRDRLWGVLIVLGDPRQERLWNAAALELAKLTGALLIGALERKRLEVRLLKRADIQRLLFDLSGDAIFVAEADTGNLVDANQAAQELVGYSLEEIQRMHQTDLHPVEHRELSRKMFEQLRNSPNKRFSELLVLHRAGHCVPVEIGASGVVELDGRKVLLGAFRNVAPLQRMELALRTSEGRYRVLVDGTSDFIFTSDRQGRLTSVNRSLLSALGVTPERLLGRTAREIAVLGDRTSDFETAQERALAGAIAEVQITVPQRGDGDRSYHVVVSPLRDDLGEVAGSVGVARNITEAKRTEDSLRLRLAIQEALSGIASEMIQRPVEEIDSVVTRGLFRLGDLAKAARVAIWVRTPHQRARLTHEARIADLPVRHSDIPTSLFAHYAEMLSQRQIVLVQSPDDLPAEAVSERAWIAAHGFQPLLFVPLFSRNEFYGTLGFYGNVGEERHWAPEFVSLLELAGAILVGGLERCKAEVALRENQKRLAEILEISPVGICIVDKEGVITYANTSAERILGLPREQICGRQHAAFDFRASTQEGGRILPEDLPFSLVSRSGKPVFGVEYALWRANESEPSTILSVNAAPLQDASGTLQAVVATFVDITERVKQEQERRRLEAQVQHAQKLESLGLLAGGIAHDFNNLLVAILGNLDLALSDLPSDSPALANLRDAELASRRAADLTRQMLAYSGKGSLNVEPTDLNSELQEVLGMLKVSLSKKVALKLDLAPQLPSIDADASQLRQVILNLVINASEAIGDQVGSVVLSTGIVECDRDYLSENWLDEQLLPGTYVYLDVSDTGCGMDADTLARVFDPFFSTKFTGRGLGLAATQGIVRGHRGAIRIQSEVGKGTTFRILLPQGQLQEDRGEGSAQRRPWRGSGSVLLIDDEESVRRVGKQMLERLGFLVLVASDGPEGIAVLSSQADRVRVVLLDLTMPGMDGGETLRELRRHRPDLKIVLMSGYSEQHVQERISAGEADGFLQKPFQLGALRSLLQDMSDSSQPR